MDQQEALRIFDERVRHRLDKSSGCWIPLVAGGPYKSIRVRPKMYHIHRLAYLAFKGEVGGMQVLHECDNPACCNPDHLFLGTQADNMADMDRKGRRKGWNPVGVKNPSAKLTPKQVRQIRKSNEMQKDIAVRFGVSAALVSAIKRGDVWKSI